MNKIKYFIISILFVSCNKINQYECVCYDNIGTDSVSYESYVTKNDKVSAEQYCTMISTASRPCWIVE